MPKLNPEVYSFFYAFLFFIFWKNIVDFFSGFGLLADSIAYILFFVGLFFVSRWFSNAVLEQIHNLGVF